VVVLPFVNLSADPANEHFSDGLTEEIIARLAGVRGLRVISRTSAMHYKGSNKPLRQIAEELDVTHVVEGSVRWGEGRVRITAQLVDAGSDEHVWAENYQHELHDSFKVQEEIAQAIARVLAIELRAPVPERLARQEVRDPEAFEMFRRARHLWNSRTREAHDQAIYYYQKAIERDSTYAEAYAGLSHTFLTLHQLYSPTSEEEAYSRVKWAAERALALDSESGDAHTALSSVLWWQQNWPGAERELRRAIELNPGDSAARSWYALLLAGMGRLDEAVDQSRQAYLLDPFALIVSITYAWACYLARDYDTAIEQYRKTAEINDSWSPIYQQLGLSYSARGMHEAAIAEVSRALALAPRASGSLADLAFVYARAGRQPEAVQLLQRAKTAAPEPFAIARAHAALEQPDSAFVWLERSQWRWVHRAARADPGLDPLRRDPRFTQLSERIDRTLGLK
jgi:TolB-like protein/tetratricopeptide (TPR) repeat protein